MTVGAQDDKVVIVRDGSVDLNAINSRLYERDSDRKHKWSKKADLVEVFEDGSAATACTTTKHGPVRFERVELRMKDLTDPKAPVDVTIVADNEGFPSKLKFLMPDEWRFVFRNWDHRLVYGTRAKHVERPIDLQQVAVTPHGGGAVAVYPPAPSAETFLCVKFRDD